MDYLRKLLPKEPDWNICWEEFEKVLPSFVSAMSQTEQNPVFHGEGDVWTHTKNGL